MTSDSIFWWPKKWGLNCAPRLLCFCGLLYSSTVASPGVALRAPTHSHSASQLASISSSSRSSTGHHHRLRIVTVTVLDLPDLRCLHQPALRGTCLDTAKPLGIPPDCNYSAAGSRSLSAVASLSSPLFEVVRQWYEAGTCLLRS